MSPDESPSIYSLPLFPLHTVLFPQFTLQLHIFEARYKAMISSCIERNAPFGVVLIREGQETGPVAVPHDVGCMARILDFKQLEDGRLHLLAVGERRFRLLEYRETELAYLVGQVETLEDIPPVPEAASPMVAKMTTLFQTYLRLLSETASLQLPEIELPEDPSVLAFCIASILQMSLADKQRLLAMTDSQERLFEEIRFLRHQIEDLVAIRARRASSAEESEPQVVIAEPIDLRTEGWRRFEQESRN